MAADVDSGCCPQSISSIEGRRMGMNNYKV